MLSKIQKLILPLAILLVVLVPIKVFAIYICECNTGITKTYTTQQDCENPMFANSCPNYCEGGVCKEEGGGSESEGGGQETEGGGSESEGGGHEIIPSYESAELDNPLAGNETSIPNLIARVIKIILGLVGIVSLVMFIYAGFLWLTAQGSMEKVKKGKDVMLYSVIGIVIVFSSYIVLNYLFGILTF